VAREGQFEALARRFDAVDQCFDAVGPCFDGLGERIDRVEERLDQRIDRLEQRLEHRIDVQRASVDGLRSDLTQVALAVWGETESHQRRKRSSGLVRGP
jgi:hypothetical protein